MNTKRLVYIAVFTALIVVGGLVSVPIPFTQVEMSLQTVFVIMAGVVLGARDGALSVLIYLAMGLLGLPVFTKGGGLGYVFMPSFGYLLGFPVSASVSGLICSKLKNPTKSRVFASALAGMIPTYVIGITYQVLILYYYMHTAWGAVIAGVPAILVLYVKDAVLCGLVAAVYPALKRAVRGRERKPRDGGVKAVNR